MTNDIAAIRKEYMLEQLDESSVQEDPIRQFEAWWLEVMKSNIEEPNAMTLATADLTGKPSARIVLLKGINEEGFMFFTNYESAKGIQLSQNPSAALVFFWKEVERQVRIEGTVEKLPAADSDEYFNSRPEGSKLGAWASPQSKVIASREILEKNIGVIEDKFSGKNIERPQFWGGYVVKPVWVEFWQGRPGRLHDRIVYTKQDPGWKIERLAP